MVCRAMTQKSQWLWRFIPRVTGASHGVQHYTGTSFGPESHAVAALMIHQSHSGRSIDPEVTVALEIHTQSHWGRSHDPVSQESCMAQSHRSHGDSQWQVLWSRVTAEELQESWGTAGSDWPAEHTLWQASIVAGWPSIWNCGRPAMWQTGRAGWLCIHCGRPALWQTGQACGKKAE